MSSGVTLIVLLILKIAGNYGEVATLWQPSVRRTPQKLKIEKWLVIGAAIFTNYAIEYAAFYATVLAGTQFSTERLCEVQVSK